MKVMCINDNWKSTPTVSNRQKPAFGDIDEVVDVQEFFGGHFYDLQRFPDSLFSIEMFAPLSDEPAEIIEEQQPEYATA